MRSKGELAHFDDFSIDRTRSIPVKLIANKKIKWVKLFDYWDGSL
jgi:hypothetical protein